MLCGQKSIFFSQTVLETARVAYRQMKGITRTIIKALQKRKLPCLLNKVDKIAPTFGKLILANYWDLHLINYIQKRLVDFKVS